MNTQLINHPQAVPVPASKFAPKDLISTRDLSPKDAEGLLHLAGLMKARPVDFRDALSGKQLVMFFEKQSLRTRLTFEAEPLERVSQLRHREPVARGKRPSAVHRIALGRMTKQSIEDLM